MAQNFGETRNVELSTIKYIRDSFLASWSGINVVAGFPDEEKIALPTVAIILDSDNSDRREIGSNELNSVYNIIIHIFAKSHPQRMDLADFLKNKIKTGWTYYTHANQSGSNETVERIEAGRINFVNFIQNARLEFGEDVEVYDRFRHIMAVDVRVN